MKNLEINTELSYSQDNWQFDENFERIQGDTFWYKDWGNYIAPESLEDLYDIDFTTPKENLLNLLEEEFCYTELNLDDTLDNIVAEIFSRYNIEDIIEFVTVLQHYNIKDIKKFDRYITNGHSQRDSYEIFIPIELIKEVSDVTSLYSQIDNYCWNSEIYGDITISFDFEIVRDGLNDKVIMNFEEVFEFQEFSMGSYRVSLNIDRIINYIKKQTFNNLQESDYLLMKTQLELIDYTDIDY